jgi:hypothetical protein
MCIGFEDFHEVDDEDFKDEDEWLEERASRNARGSYRRSVTGY